MDAEITYPAVKHCSRKLQTSKLVFRWLFLSLGAISIVLNLWLQGRPWCLIALLALWWLWAQFVNPDTTGYNRIYQFTKAVVYLCLQLALIVLIFNLRWRIWLNYVFPFVIFPALLLLGILLFTNFRQQQYNIIPLLIFDLYCIIFSAVTIFLHLATWPMLVLLCVSVALFIATAAIMNVNLLKEFAKHYSLK